MAMAHALLTSLGGGGESVYGFSVSTSSPLGTPMPKLMAMAMPCSQPSSNSRRRGSSPSSSSLPFMVVIYQQLYAPRPSSLASSSPSAVLLPTKEGEGERERDDDEDESEGAELHLRLDDLDAERDFRRRRPRPRLNIDRERPRFPAKPGKRQNVPARARKMILELAASPHPHQFLSTCSSMNLERADWLYVIRYFREQEDKSLLLLQVYYVFLPCNMIFHPSTLENAQCLYSLTQIEKSSRYFLITVLERENLEIRNTNRVCMSIAIDN